MPSSLSVYSNGIHDVTHISEQHLLLLGRVLLCLRESRVSKRKREITKYFVHGLHALHTSRVSVKPHNLYPHVVCHGREAGRARRRVRIYMYVLRGALPPRYGHGYARHFTCMEDAELVNNAMCTIPGG